MTVSLGSHRARILACVGEHPGTHLREIQRRLGIGNGVTQYHLNALEKQSQVVSRRFGLFKRYYPLDVLPVDQAILDVLLRETDRAIILLLLDRPATQIEIARRLGIAASSVNWHMWRLKQGKVVEATRSGRCVLYTVPANERARILQVIDQRRPTIAARLADRFGELIAGLAEPDTNRGDP